MESPDRALHKECFHRSYARFRGYVRWKFHFTEEDAADVVMTCFEAALKKQFPTAGDIEKYMYFLIHKRSLTLLAEKQKRAKHEYAFVDGAEDNVESAGLGDPADAVVERIGVFNVVKLLTEEEREHLALMLSGYDSTSSATELGIDPGHERVRRHRLHRKIDQLSRQRAEAQK
ncbi:sigma-70 family RNA polymerase sigma factor [Streptomyces sp. NPDC052503]|uniref:sigma-70 family RNA polymerase sigma factor n=1 Tax=Streptomyces sp. NPDC052503 TaxID=3156683 RepID=UPI001371741B|nr:sigma-70 family RNA polymerase sigma factor [Streptomyces sp. SID7834]MYT57983.1 hypothetical protein [Streptomyces sp. SID7834]